MLSRAVTFRGCLGSWDILLPGMGAPESPAQLCCAPWCVWLLAMPWSLETPALRSESLVCFWGVITFEGVRENPFPSSCPWKASPESLWRALLPTPTTTLAPGGIQDRRSVNCTDAFLTPSFHRLTQELSLEPHCPPLCACGRHLLSPGLSEGPGRS